LIKLTHTYCFLFLLFTSTSALAQSKIFVNARLAEEKTIIISQTITFTNTSDEVWDEVYLTDWANSFSSKQTALAQRFDENYLKKFHLAKDKDRGKTLINTITQNGVSLAFSRPEGHQDILKIALETTIAPGEAYTLSLSYQVVLPHAKFTRYGYTKVGDYNLRYWYLTPVIYQDKKWQFYSNKNLNDRYFPPSDIKINFSVPEDFIVTTDLETSSESTSYKGGDRIYIISGNQRVRTPLFLRQESSYYTVDTDYLQLVTNIKDKESTPQYKALAIDRITGFLNEKLGPYPHEKLLVSDIDYEQNPVYGLNDLPDFLRPFPKGFQYDVKMAKTIINTYVNSTVIINPRNDRWILDGIKVYLLKTYLDTYYPDLKIVGNLDKYWLVRQFYASKIDFTDQFNIQYMNMARLNLDQALTTPYDSLIKFNKNIANAYKSGIGLNYLGEFIGQEKLQKSIADFYENKALKLTTSDDFIAYLKENTDKDINWFLDEYLTTRQKIDFTIKKSKIKGDSLQIVLKNKRKNHMPISVFGFKNDSLVSKRWVENVVDTASIYYDKESVDRLVLNYDKVIPEFNQRDNYKNPKALFGFDKPLQFKLFQDFENPDKSQVFFQPVLDFNVYDGFTPGIKAYNSTVLAKGFRYRVEPQFGLRSRALVGSASVSYTHNIEHGNLFSVRYGISGNTFSFADGLFFRRIAPFVNLTWRPDDLRSDKRQSLTARFLSVNRDENPNQLEQPNYDVLNFRYTKRNPGIVNTFNWNTDLQFARNFGKISATAFYRHLYLNNRQLNLRFYAGSFLYNNTRETGDFFSFALDRPTDYLFDFDYLARSDASGLASQQIIIAEGGFKSRLRDPFANQWIATTNASTTIWKYVYAYGDVGVIKSLDINPRFVYDSGIQVALLDDFFELFFPIYSNNGLEIAQANYEERIRFQVQLSIDTVIRLFTRRWY